MAHVRLILLFLAIKRDDKIWESKWSCHDHQLWDMFCFSLLSKEMVKYEEAEESRSSRQL